LHSFSSDNLIFNDGNISSTFSIESSLITLRMNVPYSITYRQAQSVIISLDLSLASNTFINSSDTWIFIVKPSTLNICLLLRIKFLWINFPHKIRYELHRLLIKWSVLSTSLSCLEEIYRIISFGSWSAHKISHGSIKMPLIVILRISIDNSTKSSLCSSNRSAINLNKFT